MRHDFSGVTPERLAELFPVILSEHDPAWARAYSREAANLRRLFGRENIVRISHIGSTSVSGLLSKPTVDILLEVKPFDKDAQTEKMLDRGYAVNTPPQDIIMYLKGYTPDGFRGQAYHIHVRAPGGHDELYFRDYLRAHPEAAAEYAELKKNLQTDYPHDRDGYTDAKGAFIKRCTLLARAEFPDRY